MDRKIILETERLYCREMIPSDFYSLCKILQDEEVMYAYEHAFSDKEAKEWLNKQIENYEEYGIGLWAVILKETHEMIGQCGLTLQECNQKKILELGYLFRKDVWKNGYAIEAARACKKYAFKERFATEVHSIIRDNNIASQNVAKRNGMVLRGEMMKYYYGIEMPHLIFSVKEGNFVV